MADFSQIDQLLVYETCVPDISGNNLRNIHIAVSGLGVIYFPKITEIIEMLSHHEHLKYDMWINELMDISVSNHQPHDCLLNHLFGRRSK